MQLALLCYHHHPQEEGMEFNGLSMGARRDEDIALDMMKFIAGTTGYTKTIGGTGFQAASSMKPEDQAKHLLDLYGECLQAVKGKK